MFKFTSVSNYSPLCIKNCLYKKFKTKIIRHKLVLSLNNTIKKQTNEFTQLNSIEVSKYLRAQSLYLKHSDNTMRVELNKKHPIYEIKMIFSSEFLISNLNKDNSENDKMLLNYKYLIESHQNKLNQESIIYILVNKIDKKEGVMFKGLVKENKIEIVQMTPLNDLLKSFEKYIDYTGRLQKLYEGKMTKLKEETKNSINDFIYHELGIGENEIVFCNSICIEKNKKMNINWSESLRKFLL